MPVGGLKPQLYNLLIYYLQSMLPRDSIDWIIVVENGAKENMEDNFWKRKEINETDPNQKKNRAEKLNRQSLHQPGKKGGIDSLVQVDYSFIFVLNGK